MFGQKSCSDLRTWLLGVGFFYFLPALADAETPRPILQVATIEHPPHSFQGEGQVVGFFPEVLKQVLEPVGYQLVFTLFPPKRTLFTLQSGNVDIVLPLVKNEEREKTLWFSKPVTCTGSVFYHRQDQPVRWHQWSDLAGYRIGGNGSYAYNPELMEAMDSGLIQVELAYDEAPNELNLRKLLAHRIDLAILNPDVYSWLKEKAAPAYDTIVPVEGPMAGDWRGFYVGFSKHRPGTEALRDAFDSGLTAFQKTPEWSALIARYHIQVTSCPEASVSAP